MQLLGGPGEREPGTSSDSASGSSGTGSGSSRRERCGGELFYPAGPETGNASGQNQYVQ